MPRRSKHPSAPFPFAWEEATIADLQDGMSRGELSARGLVEEYLERIEALDRQGPELRAVIEVNPDALAIAGALDRERADTGARGPLHGIPVLLKDNIATADRMETTAGSLALVGAKPARDAFVAERLRAAGAVILGKANMSEWANFRSSHSTSGWSARGGQCRNPYALDRSPLGSSSGSGAAVAANLCAVAVGTETDGSILAPSSCNGIVGIKPTVGLVSRAGIIPISHSQDTAGPMCRTVRDAAILLGAMAGVDPRDPTTERSLGRSSADYTVLLDAGGLKGARIGVPRSKLFGYSPATDRIAARALEAMKDAGAVLVDPADIPTLGKFNRAEFEVLLVEFKADLESYLSDLAPGGQARTLQELIEFNQEHQAEEMPYFAQETFEKSARKGPLSGSAYKKAVAKCRRLTRAEGIDAVMDTYRLDALVAPTGGPACLIDLVNGDYFSGSSTSVAAVAGYPSITVPAGFVHGLPIGISFFGRAYSEGTLLRFAFAFEQATKVRKPPGFLPTADLSSGP